MARLALLFEAEEHSPYIRLADELRNACERYSISSPVLNASCTSTTGEGAWLVLLVSHSGRSLNGEVLVARGALGVLAPVELRGTPPRLAMLLVIEGDPEPAFALVQLGLEAARRAGTRVRPVMDLSGFKV